MLSFRKSKKVLNITIEDYVIRLVETHGRDLSTIKLQEERALPSGVIEQGKIVDEIEFYDFMKELVKELKIKNRDIHFNVPDSIVIMRQVELPSHLKDKKEALEHLEMEIGRTIHLPFQDPIIDLIHYQDDKKEQEDAMAETKTVTFFAVPGEEVRKYTEIFLDVSLNPIAADVGILGNYRYFHHTNTTYENQVYLIVELKMTSIHLGIFSNNKIEFLRYQDLDLNLNKSSENQLTNEITWEYLESGEMVASILDDQVAELERIMNFYRFSLHKGEKMVTHIVLLGDYPKLASIYEQMKGQYEDTKMIHLNHQQIEKTNENLSPRFIPTLGLSLRGGTEDASRG